MSYVQRVTSLQLHSAMTASSPVPAERASAPALAPDRVEPRDERAAVFVVAAIAASQLVPGVAEAEAVGGTGFVLGALARIGGKAVSEHIVPFAASGVRKALQIGGGMATTYAADRIVHELLNDEVLPKPIRAAAHAADEAFKSLLHHGGHG